MSNKKKEVKDKKWAWKFFHFYW